MHVYDYFEHDGTPFIAMEYVAGGSLRPHLGHMTFPQIIGVLDGVLAALAHAEQHGIVHRDLKPENVLVAPDGHVKIADFGIAKAINRVNPSGFLTATGMAIGTPAYMAPEQAMASGVGPWTDLYAVGCMAYEFFTSTLPFVDPHAAEAAPVAVLLRRINEEVPAAATLNESLPEPLSDWIDGLLVRDPEARTRSAAAAFDDLEDLVLGMVGARWRRAARLPSSAVETDVDPLSMTGIATPPPDVAIPEPSTAPPDVASPSPRPRLRRHRGSRASRRADPELRDLSRAPTAPATDTRPPRDGRSTHAARAGLTLPGIAGGTSRTTPGTGGARLGTPAARRPQPRHSRTRDRSRLGRDACAPHARVRPSAGRSGRRRGSRRDPTAARARGGRGRGTARRRGLSAGPLARRRSADPRRQADRERRAQARGAGRLAAPEDGW